jgi:hypothetical protein
MFIVYLFLSQSSCFVHLFSSCFLLVSFSIHISLLPSFIFTFTLFILIFPPTSLPPTSTSLLPPSPFHLLPSCYHPSPTPLPHSPNTATDGLWDVMTSQAAVDYVTDNLIRAGILPPRSEQSDDCTFQDRSAPTRGIILFIVV